MDDLISRESVKEILNSNALPYHVVPNVWDAINQLPSAQPTFDARDTQYNLPIGTDVISRKQAVDALRKMQTYKLFSGDDMLLIDQAGAMTELMLLPSAQPEIVRCKDCDWWTKQEDSPQGRCELLQMYPTGGWFCGNARRREVTT